MKVACWLLIAELAGGGLAWSIAGATQRSEDAEKRGAVEESAASSVQVPLANAPVDEEECTAGVDECVALMRSRFSDRGTLGMLLPESTRVEGGEVRWRIARIIPGSAADEADLRGGDVIVSWDGEKLPAVPIELFLRRIKIGDVVRVGIARDGETRTVELRARRASEEIMEGWLLGYVYANFSSDVFDDYQKRLMRRLASE